MDALPEGMIAPDVVERADELAEQFASARPFRHIAIDEFFTPDTARSLADGFPDFDEKLAMNENGEVGAKAVNENIRDLGGPWTGLDSLVQSSAFRDLISRITGVPDLLYDPHYFGGGTHENLHGQSLDAHVDFNFHPVTRHHRRLNLIIYLTETWDDAWGGSIQLHKDPYLPPSEDEIAVLTPLFNRCVIFETNEHSWHGFPRIDLPEDQRHISRKSFALYYYTISRPGAELGPEHSTIYVEQHLPEDLAPGEALAPETVQHIRNLVASRDQHLRRLYGNIKQLYTELNELKERYGLQVSPGIADEPPGSGRKTSGITEGADPGDGVADEFEGDLQATHKDSGMSGEAPDATRDRLKAELARRELQIRHLEQRAAAFEGSTSWRVTRPLRALKRLISGT